MLLCSPRSDFNIVLVGVSDIFVTHQAQIKALEKRSVALPHLCWSRVSNILSYALKSLICKEFDMLTRLEVDGFKNLIRFAVDLGPFNCMAGPNGVGKSNIFDAIRLLSLLASNTLPDAARRVRGELETANVRDLFWTDGEEMADEFRIAAEMIVERSVFDDIGRAVEATSTYLRYEIKMGYEEPDFDNPDVGGQRTSAFPTHARVFRCGYSP